MHKTYSPWKHRLLIAQRLISKRFNKLMGRRNMRLQPHSLFYIKAGYHHAHKAEEFDDTGNTEEWQREVYELAASLIKQSLGATVIDVGCGSAWKLIHLMGQFNTTGIETNPTYTWLKNKYPERNWLLFDETDSHTLQADLIICADVIEHLEDPDTLLDFLENIRFKQLVISTPERDAVAGSMDYGPPENTAHYREWNAIEFKLYVGERFKIKEQVIFKYKSVTQALICEKK
jgi:2-polyprenyl-3-methyl-5-hydroxy-6-metoxy-1,4-benzoquinol methylase